jgi:flavin-dependent dehydrogenase
VIRLRTAAREEVLRARFVIGADGAVSSVAQHLGLSRNREWIVGVEDVYYGLPLEGAPRFDCFLDPRLAPGYLAWVVNDGSAAHIGVGGFASGFRPRASLEIFKRRLSRHFNFERAERVETRGGKIPVGGVLPRIAGRHGLLVGDAAGAVSPLTAGGLDPCLRLSSLAAGVSANYLHTGDSQSLEAYDGAVFRRHFQTRLLLRRVLSLVNHPLAMEIGFCALAMPMLKPLAWRVFFGRGSFPDSPVPGLKYGLPESAR